MDDGVGIRVVECLEKDPIIQPLPVTFQYLNTGGFAILDKIDGYSHAILVDAADMPEKGLKPGEIIHIENITTFSEQTISGTSSHGLTLRQVLQYAKIGGYKPPPIIEL